MIRIACAADIHLDERATCGGVTVLGADGRNIRTVDRERCLEFVVEDAIRQDCDLALIAGDLFERPRPTPGEYCAANRALDRLASHMPVIVCGDNHGLPQSPLEAHALAPLQGRHPNLTIGLRPDIVHLTIAGQRLDVAVIPWPRRSSMALNLSDGETRTRGEIDALVGAAWSGIVQGLSKRKKPGVPLIAVAHAMVREAVFGNGRSPDQESLTLGVNDFAGFDLAVLGDIHQEQWITGKAFYCGSTDRDGFGDEHGDPCWICVEMEGESIDGMANFPTPSRRYLTLIPEELESDPLTRLGTMDLETIPVVRVKGSVTAEEYDALQSRLAVWRQVPTFSEALDIERQTRARADTVTDDLSPAAALTEWARLHGREAELSALLEQHDAVVGSVA